MTQPVWEDDALIVGEGGRRQTIVGVGTDQQSQCLLSLSTIACAVKTVP